MAGGKVLDAGNCREVLDARVEQVNRKWQEFRETEQDALPDAERAHRNTLPMQAAIASMTDVARSIGNLSLEMDGVVYAPDDIQACQQLMASLPRAESAKTR